MNNSATTHIRIDPTACRAVGICAHLSPQIQLDIWGYPIEPRESLPERDARAAATACPHRAIAQRPVTR